MVPTKNREDDGRFSLADRGENDVLPAFILFLEGLNVPANRAPGDSPRTTSLPVGSGTGPIHT
jgi:hypothetical protein